MDVIELPGVVYLASDIHLGPNIMRTNHAFYQFLQKAALEADALVLVGDIFNVWFGDDVMFNAPADWLTEAQAAFKQFTSLKPLYVLRGNRDFLLGESFCRSLGITLLNEQTVLNTQAGLLYVTHGDEFCTDDLGYMRLRTFVRNPKNQSLFLKLPLWLRRWIANKARSVSADFHERPQQAIYTTNSQAMRDALAQLPSVRYLVHGHTHKPEVSLLENTSVTKIVLPDWDHDHGASPRGGYLRIDAYGAQLHAY